MARPSRRVSGVETEGPDASPTGPWIFWETAPLAPSFYPRNKWDPPETHQDLGDDRSMARPARSTGTCAARRRRRTVALPMLSIDATRLILGAVLLAFGRKLFWVFVGAVGFVAGMRLAERFLPGTPDDTVILYSIIAGVVCAAMAVAIRKVAVAAAGFFAGGYFLVQLLNVSAGGVPLAGHGQQIAPAVLFLVGGIVGAVLMNILFNWTLIVLSSIGGATLICETLTANRQGVQNALSFYSGVKPHGDAPALDPHVVSVVFTVLVIIGVLVQAGTFRKLRQQAPPSPQM